MNAPIAPIRCTPVSGAGDFSTFIRVPRLIYRGQKGFVPRLDFAEKLALGPKQAPFFKHGTAQYWLAWRGNEVVGRISAQIDRLQTEPYGVFGCLEAVDDAGVVRALLACAESWLKERGFKTARGPFTLSINGESGLMLEGQDAGPMIMMPWHPLYLAKHVQDAGYALVKSLLCYMVDPHALNPGFVGRMVNLPRMPESLHVRGLNMKDLDGEAKIITDIFNNAWHDNWGFVPIAVEEIETLAHAFKMFLVPECGAIVEVDGKPIAMALVLPNLELLTGDFGGRLFPFNWARLLYRAAKKDYRSGRMLLFGVADSVRGTLLGSVAPFMMLSQFALYAKKFRLTELEMSWVLDDNHAVQSLLKRFGARKTKTYGVFEKALA